MDPTFYEDNLVSFSVQSPVAMKMKSNMSLELFAPPEKRDRMGDLELPTPELEKFLLQVNSDVAFTASTPTTQILFPKSVTEEQEAYARGFIDALEELHKRQGQPALDASSVCKQDFVMDATNSQSNLIGDPGASVEDIISNRMQVRRGSTVHHMCTTVGSEHPLLANPIIATPSSYSGYIIPQSLSTGTIPFASSNVLPRRLSEEPQTVPNLGSTPPISPINMDDQEKVKLERKRARNRLAAKKCRSRKLEHIALLEVRVCELKEQNAAMSQTSLLIKDQVNTLRQQLFDHVSHGCQLISSVPDTGLVTSQMGS